MADEVAASARRTIELARAALGEIEADSSGSAPAPPLPPPPKPPPPPPFDLPSATSTLQNIDSFFGIAGTPHTYSAPDPSIDDGHLSLAHGPAPAAVPLRVRTVGISTTLSPSRTGAQHRRGKHPRPDSPNSATDASHAVHALQAMQGKKSPLEERLARPAEETGGFFETDARLNDLHFDSTKGDARPVTEWARSFRRYPGQDMGDGGVGFSTVSMSTSMSTHHHRALQEKGMASTYDHLDHAPHAAHKGERQRAARKLRRDTPSGSSSERRGTFFGLYTTDEASVEAGRHADIERGLAERAEALREKARRASKRMRGGGERGGHHGPRTPTSGGGRRARRGEKGRAEKQRWRRETSRFV
jgi:hypothetical protein